MLRLEELKEQYLIEQQHIKDIIGLCDNKNIKEIVFGKLVVQFFPDKPEPMALDPVSLSKALADHMPSDEQMMFASTEEIEEPKE